MGALVCGLSLLCAIGGGVGGTVICAGTHERTGRLQWHWKEDDPAGLKQMYVQYSTNFPTEGVYYQLENFLCIRDAAHPDDRRCLRAREIGPSGVTLDQQVINYESKIRWSDGSYTTSRFDSGDWEVYPPVVWHQSGFLADVTPYRIDITTVQRLVDPTGGSEWVFLDSLTAYTMALDF